MVSTFVHAGFALVVATGLLGGAADRRALGAILLVVVLPEADALLGPVYPGAHRTVGHTVVLPVVAGLLLYYDTQRREPSWLRERVADRWIGVAWVALAVHLTAHVALDWTHLEGVNLFWPLRDAFTALDGVLTWSPTDGFVQTFVDIRVDPATGQARVGADVTGTRASVHVNNPVEPDTPAALAEAEVIDRRFPVAGRGWRLYLLGLGLFIGVARRLQRAPPAEDSPHERAGPARDSEPE